MNLSKNSEPSFHMTLKKKRILTFLCALWPGGGYMYFGMMKKGALLMSLFTATAGLTQTVGWKFLGFLLPVIWCYCFFDTFHCSRLSEAQRKAEDTWFFRKTVRMLREDPLNSLKERKNIVGTLLLLFALYTIVYAVFPLGRRIFLGPADTFRYPDSRCCRTAVHAGQTSAAKRRGGT